MIITNSLGSNYTSEDRKLVFKLLFQPWRWKKGKESKQLTETIQSQFQPQKVRPFKVSPLKVELFLKGRQAIKEALKQLNIVYGDEIIVQAFTCVAVVEPILDLGAIPIYADVISHSLNPSLENIKKVVSKKTKAIILQHTLGYINPENEKIWDWCQKNNIAVIQDLAHLAILSTKMYKKVQVSTNTQIFSFSQDKVFDGISGGALISNISNKIPKFNDSNHQTYCETAKLLIYPLVTHAIRSTYNFGIGKLIHFLAKKIGLMNSPICTPKETSLPNAFAALALQQFNRLDKIIEHRKNIALQYNELINNRFKIVSKKDIENGSNLRYPLYINNRDELENNLRKYNFYLMDHWYDAPVSPKWIDFNKVNYKKGSCLNAENLSNHIFNLPTHVNINLTKAKELSELINKYAVSSF